MNLDFKLASFIEIFCALWKFALLILFRFFLRKFFCNIGYRSLKRSCCESLLHERLVVACLLSSCESLSLVVCASMLDELDCLLFMCIIARHSRLFMCIVVGQIGTYVNRNQQR